MHIVAAAADTVQESAGSESTGREVAAPAETLRTLERDAQPFSSIPGPKALDVQAYNARNHQYILELHEQYGDIVAADLSSMARASSTEPTKRVVFVRNPELVRTVLRHSAFAKT